MQAPKTLPLILCIAILAFFVRFYYFQEHLGSALSTAPVLDAKHYDEAARSLLSGSHPERLGGGFRPLLYPFFLATIYRLAGGWDIILALVVQHLLGVGTAVLVMLLAERLFSDRLAVGGAGLLYVLAGPPLYFEGELLGTSLFTGLVTLFLWLLLRAEDRPSLLAWVPVGLVLALAVEARPTILTFVPAMLAAPWLFQRRRSKGPILALALALACLIGTAAIRIPWSGGFRLLPAAGGINLYLGNRSGADGMIPRQDRAVTYGETYRDSVQVYAEQVYREEMGQAGVQGGGQGELDPAILSRYWTGRALDEIRQHKLEWLGLMLRKVWFVAWNHEIPNNKSYSFIQAEESPILRHLPVQWWLLLALAPCGLWYGWRHASRKGLYWLTTFLLLYAAGLTLFFVNSRFRIPLWPPMAVLAGGGLCAFRGRIRQGSWPLRELALVAVAMLFSLTTWADVELPGHARDFFFRSIAHLQRGEGEAAVADAEASLSLDPTDPAVHYQLGASQQALGHPRAAVNAYRRATKLNPREPRAFNGLGVALEALDQPTAAYGNYLHALELLPGYAPALINAALLELRAGLSKRAEEKISIAETMGDDSVQLLCARALFEEINGDRKKAGEIWSIVNDENPAMGAAIAAAQEERIDPARLNSID